jgi:hypothetical protein
MDRRACGCRRSLIQPAGVGDGDADAAADAVDAAAAPRDFRASCLATLPGRPVA